MRRLFCLIVLLSAGSFHAFAQQPTAAARAAARLPARSSSLSSTIQGNALTSANQPMVNATVRLRDARSGRIADTQQTDASGLFVFRGVEPGSYVVEILASDGTSILAASQIVHINAGEAVSAIVKLPFRIPPFAGVLGSAPSAAAVVTEAAATAVLAVTAPGALGDPTCPLR